LDCFFINLLFFCFGSKILGIGLNILSKCFVKFSKRMNHPIKLFFHDLIDSFQPLLTLNFDILGFWATMARFARLGAICPRTRLCIDLCDWIQLLRGWVLKITQDFFNEILSKVDFYILWLWLIFGRTGRTSIISLLRAMLASNSLFLNALMQVTVSISSTSLTFSESVTKIKALRVSGSLELSKDYFINARYFWVG